MIPMMLPVEKIGESAIKSIHSGWNGCAIITGTISMSRYN